MQAKGELSIFDALRPRALKCSGKLFTGLHLLEILKVGPEPHDIESPIAPGVIPNRVIFQGREILAQALLVLGLKLPVQINDRRECTPVLRRAVRRFKTIKDATTGEKRAITVGDIWQMDVNEFAQRVYKNFNCPKKPLFTRPLSISPSPEEYWIWPFLEKRPTAVHSCLKLYKCPLDLHFSHEALRLGTGRLVGNKPGGKQEFEKASGLATQTACHRLECEEEQPETKKYLADAKANCEMVAAGEPDGPPRRTIAIPTSGDPHRRLIVDWPEPRYQGYTEAFDKIAEAVVAQLLNEKGNHHNPGMREALLDECARIYGSEKPVKPEHLFKHLNDRLNSKFFSADVSDILDVSMDGRLVTEQTDFRERPGDKPGIFTVEMPLAAHHEEPIERDDGEPTAVGDLSPRLVDCLDIDSEIVKGTKLLPIAIAIAEARSQVDIAKQFGCDQSQISRAKREIASRLGASGFRAPGRRP